MKHVKTFESYNGEADIPDSAKDMFDLWTDIVFDSYRIVHHFQKLDWEKTDIIDRHDHQVEWAAEAYDEDDFLWYVAIDVFDGHFEEVNYDSLELEPDSVSKMVNQVFDKVRGIDPSAVNRKVETEKESFGKKITVKKDSIRTNISWQEFTDLFEKVYPQNDTDYKLGFTFKLLGGDETKIIYYVKLTGKEGFWSLV